MGSLLARLDGMSWRLDQGAQPEDAELAALAEAAVKLGATLDLDGRRSVLAAVVRVREAIGRSRAEILERLATYGAGRRAMTAYARGGR